LQLPRLKNLESIIAADQQNFTYTSARYYAFVYRIPFIRRLEMALGLLGKQRYRNLLDLGCGAGIFLPELSRRCRNLFALDIHPHISLVKEMLNKEQVQAEMVRGDILSLPFGKERFDCIVALSLLEFIDDTDRAILEIKEAAKDAATIIIGAPVLNKITDFCYEKLIRSRVHRILHKSAQEKIIGSVKRHLIIEKIVHYPFFLPLDYSLFFGNARWVD
jgi:2-polyprenyl-3-methyl-5-hydroxy-6-metoxy-1,4-benzoquinol methylase